MTYYGNVKIPENMIIKAFELLPHVNSMVALQELLFKETGVELKISALDRYVRASFGTVNFKKLSTILLGMAERGEPLTIKAPVKCKTKQVEDLAPKDLVSEGVPVVPSPEVTPIQSAKDISDSDIDVKTDTKQDKVNAKSKTKSKTKDTEVKPSSLRFTWTEESVALLTDMWVNSSMLSTEIAAKLGCSRNAVMGKIFRLGINHTHKSSQVHYTLHNLKSFQCHWPIERNNAGVWTFCGENVVTNKAYCKNHHTLATSQIPITSYERVRQMIASGKYTSELEAYAALQASREAKVRLKTTLNSYKGEHQDVKNIDQQNQLLTAEESSNQNNRDNSSELGVTC